MLEGAKKRKWRGESQGSSRKLKEPQGVARSLTGATMLDRKLGQKCGVTLFKATGPKETLGASRRAAGEGPGA